MAETSRARRRERERGRRREKEREIGGTERGEGGRGQRDGEKVPHPTQYSVAPLSPLRLHSPPIASLSLALTLALSLSLPPPPPRGKLSRSLSLRHPPQASRGRHVYTPVAPSLNDLEPRTLNLEIVKKPEVKLGVAFAKEPDMPHVLPSQVRAEGKEGKERGGGVLLSSRPREPDTPRALRMQI
eukprot:scaffold32765_cov22-Tisochrysis_lutea.AAC.1